MLPMHAVTCKYWNDSYTMLTMHVDTTGNLLEMHTWFHPCIFVDTPSKWSHGGMDTCRYLMTMNPVCCPCVPIFMDTLQKHATSSRQQGCGNMPDAIRTTHSQPRVHDQISTWLRQETQLALDNQCLRTDSATVSCVVRMCVFTSPTSNALGKPMSYAIATCTVHSCPFMKQNRWDSP